MFRVGEVVSYGATGICTVEGIEVMSLSRGRTGKREYYILRPVAAPTCVTYVPTANEALTGKMRPVYTKNQINELLVSVRGKQLKWIDDARRRAEAYGQIVSGGMSDRLLQLIACLYLEKQSRAASGKKFCTTDEKLLNAAERIVNEEFSYALGITREQVTAYIAEKLK